MRSTEILATDEQDSTRRVSRDSRRKKQKGPKKLAATDHPFQPHTRMHVSSILMLHAKHLQRSLHARPIAVMHREHGNQRAHTAQ